VLLLLLLLLAHPLLLLLEHPLMPGFCHVQHVSSAGRWRCHLFTTIGLSWRRPIVLTSHRRPLRCRLFSFGLGDELLPPGL
jgi:hypothetical protein